MTDGYEPDAVATVVDRGGTPVVEVVGEVDLQTAPGLEHAIEQAAAEHPARVVVDLAGVSFLDSSGLNALVQAARGHRLILRAPSPAVREVLSMAGLSETMQIES